MGGWLDASRITDEPIRGTVRGIHAPEQDGAPWRLEIQSAGSSRSSLLHLPRGHAPAIEIGEIITARAEVTRAALPIHFIRRGCLLAGDGSVLAASSDGEGDFTPGWKIERGEVAISRPGSSPTMAEQRSSWVIFEHARRTACTHSGRWRALSAPDGEWLVSGHATSWGPGALPPDASPSVTISIFRVRRTPPVASSSFDGLWIDELGRALFIDHAPDGSPRATIARTLTGPCFQHPSRLLATTHELPASQEGARLIVEAGIGRVGPTYELIYEPDRLTPELHAGLHDDLEDDLGAPWALPLAAYRRASDDELRRYLAVRRRGLRHWVRSRRTR